MVALDFNDKAKWIAHDLLVYLLLNRTMRIYQDRRTLTGTFSGKVSFSVALETFAPWNLLVQKKNQIL